VQKISFLIYKIRLTDGTLAVVHVNRLKKAYGQEESKMMFEKKRENQTRNIPREKCTNFKEMNDLGADTPSWMQVVESEGDSLSEKEEVTTTESSQGILIELQGRYTCSGSCRAIRQQMAIHTSYALE